MSEKNPYALAVEQVVSGEIATKQQANAALLHIVQIHLAAQRREGRPVESYTEALHSCKGNIAYMAGYHDHEVRVRVEYLFDAVHPLLGPAAMGRPSVEEAFEMGKRMGESIKRGEPLRTYKQTGTLEPPAPGKRRRAIDLDQ